MGIHIGNWLTERAKAAGHGIEKAAKDLVYAAGEQGIGVRYNANGDGTNGSISANIGPLGYNTNNGIYANVQPTTGGGNAGKYKPAGYSRSAAATARDIAQGGMTKDEIIEFNMKHPNETAQRSE